MPPTPMMHFVERRVEPSPHPRFERRARGAQNWMERSGTDTTRGCVVVLIIIMLLLCCGVLMFLAHFFLLLKKKSNKGAIKLTPTQSK